MAPVSPFRSAGSAAPSGRNATISRPDHPHSPRVLLVVALITFGSGLMNLYSVIGPALPDRSKILRGIFPLEFLHLSRLLTLLTGFALVISSINVYRRKKRAFVAVTILACASVVLHLRKGLGYEEVALSFFLLSAFLAAVH